MIKIRTKSSFKEKYKLFCQYFLVKNIVLGLTDLRGVGCPGNLIFNIICEYY